MIFSWKCTIKRLAIGLAGALTHRRLELDCGAHGGEWREGKGREAGQGGKREGTRNFCKQIAATGWVIPAMCRWSTAITSLKCAILMTIGFSTISHVIFIISSTNYFPQSLQLQKSIILEHYILILLCLSTFYLIKEYVCGSVDITATTRWTTGSRRCFVMECWLMLAGKQSSSARSSSWRIKILLRYFYFLVC